MGREDVLAFWFGEPDEVTPAFIRQAAIDSLNAGETFYTQNLGMPELREAIASYVSRLHGPAGVDRVAVTNSGMSALMLTTQLLVGHGDRVVAVTPLWPNLVEIPKILGADVECVALEFGKTGWSLDVARLLAALTPGTRAVYINSPNNPTGWTIDAEDQRVVLAHCRRCGIWIVADDAYERLYYGGGTGRGAAPSFLDVADEDDRIVSCNTFSKSWLMTGWRLGWIVAPAAIVPELGKLIEYNTSCAPGFVQRAGIAAVTTGDETIARNIERFRRARDFLDTRLHRVPGIETVAAPGAMYTFFRVDGIDDSLAYHPGVFDVRHAADVRVADRALRGVGRRQRAHRQARRDYVVEGCVTESFPSIPYANSTEMVDAATVNGASTRSAIGSPLPVAMRRITATPGW